MKEQTFLRQVKDAIRESYAIVVIVCCATQLLVLIAAKRIDVFVFVIVAVFIGVGVIIETTDEVGHLDNARVGEEKTDVGNLGKRAADLTDCFERSALSKVVLLAINDEGRVV